ncbi:hypothetical protein [Cetobacterium sp.]|uniref:hypothetical protein n=1 Tax=Cetobacterium sp. TaxID=2071632 RepID=UPI003F3166B1
MLTIIRGAGDLSTGVIYRLYKSGFKLLVLEIENPSAIRRTVSFSECIYNEEQISATRFVVKSYDMLKVA